LNREAQLNLLRALGDPTRLSIFELLMHGTQCNCEMGEHLGLPSNLVSHHLRVLREAGLIEATRHPTDARWILYSIDKTFLVEAREGLSKLLDPERVEERQSSVCRIGSIAPSSAGLRSAEASRRRSRQLEARECR
jgi:ArsR family transcriptional regulator